MLTTQAVIGCFKKAGLVIQKQGAKSRYRCGIERDGLDVSLVRLGRLTTILVEPAFSGDYNPSWVRSQLLAAASVALAGGFRVYIPISERFVSSASEITDAELACGVFSIR